MTARHTFTVVHVEDDRPARPPQTQVLRDAGYRVLEASSAAEALSLADQEQPALVLLHADSDERFRTLADSAPALMWVTRLDRMRDFVNDAYVEFSGLSGEEAPDRLSGGEARRCALASPSGGSS